MDEFGDVLADMYAQSSSKQLALDRAVFRSLCDEVLTAQVRRPSALRARALPGPTVCLMTDNAQEARRLAAPKFALHKIASWSRSP